MQLVLSEDGGATYRFGSLLTSLCAVVGGVYVVTGMVDAFAHKSVGAFSARRLYRTPLGR